MTSCHDLQGLHHEGSLVASHSINYRDASAVERDEGAVRWRQPLPAASIANRHGIYQLDTFWCIDVHWL